MGNYVYTPNQITEGTIKRWAICCKGSVRQASVLPFLKYQCVLSELQIKLLIFLMATHFW